MPKIETYVCDRCGYVQKNWPRKNWAGGEGRDFYTLGLNVRRGHIEKWDGSWPTKTQLWCEKCCGEFNLTCEFEDSYIQPLAEKEPPFEDMLRVLIREELEAMK